MKGLLIVGLLGLVACDDTLMSVEGGVATVDLGDDYCALEQIIGDHCLSCHSAASALGGLDLETDAHAALVDVVAVIDDAAILVVPGSPDDSLLYTKMVDLQGIDQGGVMPSTGQLESGFTDAVATWITNGATLDCD